MYGAIMRNTGIRIQILYLDALTKNISTSDVSYFMMAGMRRREAFRF